MLLKFAAPVDVREPLKVDAPLCVRVLLNAAVPLDTNELLEVKVPLTVALFKVAKPDVDTVVKHL